MIIKNFNVPDVGFWWILDMLFYGIRTIDSEKISLVVFFVAFGPFLSYFYPPKHWRGCDTALNAKDILPNPIEYPGKENAFQIIMHADYYNE